MVTARVYDFDMLLHMRLLRPGLAALIVLFTTAQTPPFSPKKVTVPALQMTGLGAPPEPAPFSPKKVAVPALQMTGVEPVATTTPPFTPRKVMVPALQMTGVN
jgi:hypothetical protein